MGRLARMGVEEKCMGVVMGKAEGKRQFEDKFQL